MKKALIIVLVTFLAVGAVLTVAGFMFFREKPKLEASIEIPAEIALGSTVSLVVKVSNPHQKAVGLDSVDVADSFLAGFQVLSVEPKPTGTTHVPVLDQRSWDFGRAVPPGGKLTVTFTLKAVAEGHFSGDLDVCNPSQDFTTHVVDVVVKGK